MDQEVRVLVQCEALELLSMGLAFANSVEAGQTSVCMSEALRPVALWPCCWYVPLAICWSGSRSGAARRCMYRGWSWPFGPRTRQASRSGLSVCHRGKHTDVVADHRDVRADGTVPSCRRRLAHMPSAMLRLITFGNSPGGGKRQRWSLPSTA